MLLRLMCVGNEYGIHGVLFGDAKNMTSRVRKIKQSNTHIFLNLTLNFNQLFRSRMVILKAFLRIEIGTDK
jgi:hypothetical protein